MTTVAAPADLKRLAFVESAAVNTASYVTGSTAFAKACGYYTSAKETDALKGSLTKIEDLIKAYGAPVVSKVQEKYPTYMTTVDAKVDLAVTALQGIWADKIASSVPVAYAKAAVALTPEKVEELKAMREAYYAKIEATLESLKSRAVKLPAEVTAAVTAAIAEARARIEDAHLFEKVKAAYETVLAYPAVVAVLEKTAPVASKAADVAAPYVAKARTIAEPYVVKGMEVAGPYVNAIKEKVMPPKPAPAQQLD